MFKLLVIIFTAAIFSFTSTASAASKPKPAVKPTAKPVVTKQSENRAALVPLKEFDLARKLVNELGFSEGLPEKPADKDYLQILGGSRTFKFEAENSYDQQSDPVSIRDYPLFGAFSGGGWVHGPPNQIAVHFKVFIPVTGKYLLKVTSKGDNQLWSVAGKAFRFNSGEKFTESSIGEVFIPAGEVEFNAVIPPVGAIDCFTFTAPAYAPIEPLAGWNPARPLTATAFNETVAALLGREPLLPDDASYKTKTIEASAMANLPESVHLTDNQVRGKSVAVKWVRAFSSKAAISVPLQIETESVYRIRVRAVGTEISAGFGQRKVTVALKPQLDWVDLGTFRLRQGLNSLDILLPPTGGIDVIEISKKLSSPADYAAITKSGIQGDTPIDPAQLDAIIKNLKDQFKERI